MSLAASLTTAGQSFILKMPGLLALAPTPTPFPQPLPNRLGTASFRVSKSISSEDTLDLGKQPSLVNKEADTGWPVHLGRSTSFDYIRSSGIVDNFVLEAIPKGKWPNVFHKDFNIRKHVLPTANLNPGRFYFGF